MNNHSRHNLNHSSNGAHPIAPVPGPRCAAYDAILPVLDEPAADQRLAREARAHLATCAYCQARQRDYARLDVALLFAFGATSTPTLHMENVVPTIDGAGQPYPASVALTTHTMPDMGDADEIDHAAISASQTSARRSASPPAAATRSGWRARGKLAPLATLVAVLLIAVVVAALFAAQGRFRSSGVESASPLPTLGTFNPVYSVSMTSPTDGWALAYEVSIATNANAGSPDSVRLSLLHYSGGRWTTAASFAQYNTGSWLCTMRQMISMDSPTDGWAIEAPQDSNGHGVVGNFMLHYNGRQWRQVALPTGYEACGVKMLSPTLGWAFSYTGDLNAVAEGLGHTSQYSILRYDGHNWRPEPIDYTPPASTSLNLTSITALSPNEAWATGFLIPTGSSQGVASTNSQDAKTSVILRYQHGAWTLMRAFPQLGLVSVSFTSATEGWVVGSQNAQSILQPAFLHYYQGTWTLAASPALPFLADMYQVVMVSSTNGWAIGSVLESAGTQETLFHYNGAQWRSIAAPQLADRSRLDFSCLGIGATNGVWVMGDAGWQAMNGYPTPVFAPGYHQTATGMYPVTALILRYHNGAWQVVES